MAEKGFGVKEVNLIGASGTPTITSPNNLNLNAVNVAISTNVSIGGTLSVTGNISIGGTLTYEDVTNVDSIGVITARSGVDVDDFISVGSNIHLGNAGVITATTFSGSGASLTSIPAGQLTGTVADARISTLTASNLSGALPAISGANLTNLPAVDPTNSDIQVAYTVTANGSSAYRFAANGVVSTEDNPDLYLIRGQKYRFIKNSGGSHPFQIREASGGTAYSTGVTNNGAASGNIDFAPTYNSPAQLVYQCTSHGGMVGNIYLRDAAGNNTNVGVTTLSSSATLHTNRIIPVGGVPSGGGGGVIQIVEVGHTNEHTITQTNSSSPQQIFSATITPKFSTSKIRIELNIFAYHQNYHDGYIGLFKGSASTVITGSSQGGYSDVSSFVLRQGSFEDQSSDYQNNPTYYSYLDTAGTTSAITYNIKGLTSSSSYPTYINRSHSRGQSNSNFPKLRSTLTLTEHSA